MTIAVIISTYNNPSWLRKTLWGYVYQTRQADEIIIADDGSTSDTADLIKTFCCSLPLKHVWQEDKGFRKTKILNEAIKIATSDYLIFTDQDCIPRFDFIATHERFAESGKFLSGGYVKLPMLLSQKLDERDIRSRNAFRLSWLRENGCKMTFKYTKLVQNIFFTTLMNHVTPTHATWNGMNSSGWRKDIIEVNGFDERMAYGGEDRELGERLYNAGIRPRQIRYSAIALHLDHQRPYINQRAWDKNNMIRKETRRNNLIKTAFGLKKYTL
ncbi:MAG: glycosyltransferase family 2 protein [Prevotella sp.]|jgi:GT2 family glycosyltransferase|nr:glycosyltransferase family 2 protein [Prevotella sp.]